MADFVGHQLVVLTNTLPCRTYGTLQHIAIGAMVDYADNTVVYLHGFQLEHHDLLHLPNVMPFPIWSNQRKTRGRGLHLIDRGSCTNRRAVKMLAGHSSL